MASPKWTAGAGWAALAGGALALLLTIPFANAYYRAYPGYEVPPGWLVALRPRLGALLTFAAPEAVYNTYGRVYNWVYVLVLPAVVALHRRQERAGFRLERWGFRLVAAGLLVTFVGVAGDYWANGIGFPLELLGLLVLAVGGTVAGLAALRARWLPGWCAGLLLASGPGVFVGLTLVGHIPSGPTLLLALAWAGVGAVLLRPPPEAGRAVAES